MDVLFQFYPSIADLMGFPLVLAVWYLSFIDVLVSLLTLLFHFRWLQTLHLHFSS